jgi:glyoxylase-like metal-dependent hydrolase (beta-lactamase superfamily II)
METAAHQIERLGFRREDIRHIVITHLDVDHIGGLSDYPDAHIHVTVAEALGAIRSPDIALVSPPGHTRGHTCVAVDAGHRWVLHAGDAFYH